MPKYDAFGREIGEDTLSGLGGEATESSAAPADSWTEAQVAEAASFGATAAPDAPAAPPPPKRQPAPAAMPSFEVPAARAPVIRVRRRSGFGCLVGLIVLIAIVAVPIIAVVGLVGSAGDTFDEITDVLDSTPERVIPELAEPLAPVQPPSGLAGESMVSRANFGDALARLEKTGAGRITYIRLSPDRVDAQLVKGSRQRSAQVDFAGKLTRGPATSGASALGTVAISQIDRSAPARLVRGSAARFGVREKGINYLVLSPDSAAGHRWVAYFKNGVYVEGDRRGKVVRRIS